MKSTKTNQNQGSQLINHKELNHGTVGPRLFELMTFSLRFVDHETPVVPLSLCPSSANWKKTAKNNNDHAISWGKKRALICPHSFSTIGFLNPLYFELRVDNSGVQLRVHILQVQNLLQLFSVLDTYCSLSSWFAELQSVKTQDSETWEYIKCLLTTRKCWDTSRWHITQRTSFAASEMLVENARIVMSSINSLGDLW